jgi:hypothetical protein
MSQRIRVFLFYFFLTVLLFTSGWGIPHGKIISIHLAQIFPCILFGMYLIQGRKIYIPKLITLVFILFSLIVSATALIAANVEVAFEYQLYYVSLFLLFLYVYNEKVILKKYFLIFIKYSSVATVFYSIFIQVLLPEPFNILIPTNSSQFVYKFAGYLNHHPLGAYLVIPLSVLFITMVSTKRINDAFSLLLLFLLLIFSNLRAGYVGFISVIITTLFYERKKILSKKIVIVVVGIFLITVISLGINSRNGLNIPLLTPINESLVQNGFRGLFFNTVMNIKRIIYCDCR